MMPVVDHIGAKVAQIRESRKLTLGELAERCQLPFELIEAIESGSMIPSLAPLLKIARVLGVRLGTFLDDTENVGPVINRKGQLSKAVRFAGNAKASSSELDFHALALDKCGRHMEPFLIDLRSPSENGFAPSSHEGEEFIFVLDGQIEISYGRDLIQLSEGDSIYYDSIVDHHVHAHGDAPARILAVVYTPF
jgi:transcriptional regulator with XRE-family HTH domain